MNDIRRFSFKSLLIPLSLLFCLPVTASEVQVDNTARYVGSGRYGWTVFIVASESTLKAIDSVEYTLHPTFPNPVRYGQGRNFAISSDGWGEFNIVVKVAFKDKNREPIYLNYWLKLFEKSRQANQAQKPPSNSKTKARNRKPGGE